MTLRLVLASVLLAACAATLALVLAGDSRRRVHGERPEDFVQLYIVSWNLRHGGPVYGPLETSPALARELGWGFREDYSFANPPALAPLLHPLSRLPYPAAWWGLVAFSLLAGMAALYVTAREMGLGAWTAALLAGFFVCSLPFFVLLVLNHVESLVLAVGTLGWIALRRGRLRWGGALWGLCAAFKLFPALWVVPLVRRPFRPAAETAAVVGTGAMLLGAAVVGPEESVRFVTDVVPQSALWRGSPGNFSLVVLGDALGAPALGWAIALAVAVLTCVSLIRGPASVDRIWVAASAGALAASPLSWSYYLVLLGPCLVILATHLCWDRTGDRLLVYFLVLSLFCWPYLMGNWAEDVLPAPGGVAGVAAEVVPTAGLLVLLVAGLRRVGPDRFPPAAPLRTA